MSTRNRTQEEWHLARLPLRLSTLLAYHHTATVVSALHLKHHTLHDQLDINKTPGLTIILVPKQQLDSTPTQGIISNHQHHHRQGAEQVHGISEWGD